MQGRHDKNKADGLKSPLTTWSATARPRSEASATPRSPPRCSKAQSAIDGMSATGARSRADERSDASTPRGGGRPLVGRSPAARRATRCSAGPDGPRGADPRAHRLLLRLPHRQGRAGAAVTRASSRFVFENDWNPARGLRRVAAGRRHAHHLGDRARHRRPVAVATALFISELAPARVRGPLTHPRRAARRRALRRLRALGLLRARPEALARRAVVRRHVRVPAVRRRARSPARTTSSPGLILAIMILPIVCAISREVIATVPPEHKEAALALGATRWEMIRQAVLPYSRAGHHRRRRCSAWAARSARRSR